MTYTAKYKLKHQWFWRTVKNIKGDILPKDIPGIRVLILSDEQRVEIPLLDTMFWFSAERFTVIKKQMEKEAKQSILTD